MTRPDYVFIVGSSRTGTSFLREILNSSEDVAICDETHFFESPKTLTNLLWYLLNGPESAANWGKTELMEKLTTPGVRHELAQVGNMSSDSGVERIVDYLRSCWRWAPANINREELLHRLLASDRTERSLFDAVMACYANGKPIRGEKTPAHIYHVPTLLEWFPNAKIVHTFRDPRAIFALQKGLPFSRKGFTRLYSILRHSALIFEIYLSLDIIITWLRITQLHHQYQQLYPNNYYLFKYEDLLEIPQVHLKKLCDFLEIDLTERMLQRVSQDPSRGPSPRMQGVGGVDSWRKHLHPATDRWFVWVCKKHLLEFGYRLDKGAYRNG